MSLHANILAYNLTRIGQVAILTPSNLPIVVGMSTYQIIVAFIFVS